MTVGLVSAGLAGGCGRPLSDYERPKTPAKAADLTAGGDWASPKPFESVTVRAIFVSWKGAAGAPEAVTRTEEQALLRAKTLSDMMRDGDGNFAGLVREYSDDRISFPELARIAASDLPGHEFWIGGEIVRSFPADERAHLTAAGAHLYDNPQRLLADLAEAAFGKAAA